MGRDKLPMELIADKKSRFRSFRNREKGLKKKLYELSTLCDVKACMIVYGPDGDGPSSSQPGIWPENRSEVECIIDKYMKERKEDRGKRILNLSDVLEIRKKRADLEPPKLQEEIAKTKGRTLEGGVDEFSYVELEEIIGKLDKKLEEVENMIDFKKEETNSMNDQPTVHCSHMKGLSAIQPLDIYAPMDYSGRTLEDGVDEFSHEELMEITGKLDKKLKELENIIDFQKKKLEEVENIIDFKKKKLEEVENTIDFKKRRN